MFNTEFFKPANFVALGVIILIWLYIHNKYLAKIGI